VVEPEESRTVADVLVADGRIADVVAPGSAPTEGWDRLDAYRGCVVTPALVDMHGHLPPDNVLRLTGLFLLLHLAHGVTTVRDAGDTDGTAIPAARRGFAEGRYIGPRLFSAGPFVTKGRTRWSNSLIVGGAGDAERIATALRAQGSECMKLYENLEPDEIAALERAARQHGLVTLGHVPTRLGYEEVALADAQHFFGVPPPASLPRDHVLDRTCHWEAVDSRRVEQVIRAAVEGRRANTPTLIVTENLLRAAAPGGIDEASSALLPRFYRDVIWHSRRGLPVYRDPTPERAERLQRALEKKLLLVERLYREGGELRLGTDVQQPFVVPGAALDTEMRLFARAGIPTGAILRMATRDAARALGRPDLGTTRVGATADLLVLDRDPTSDLEALESRRAVVHAGRLYSTAELDREIREELATRDRAFSRIASAVLARLAMWQVARRFVA
jgi:cytosine/adenosine deaminase-related metal-dependent hydrolase